ncbi:22629_t:CDS:2 [Dentiscutata erythropus]|uniref:22629_t:CDS:1 n=1 Tax=Dentiscutata erythropus TaxID=1348616 RepID=A0A9N9EQB0_9GLOM|nr:22629_t:CDS:2 [Dentiscutata erythropus]
MAEFDGPQIGTSANNFFQSDRDIAIQERRAKKQQNKTGDPIECTSKVLCMILPEKIDDSDYAYIGESGFIAKKINLSTKKTVKIFKGHTGPITCLGLWYKDGIEYLITGSWDKTLRKWDSKTKESLCTFSLHTDFVKSLAISHKTSTLFSGSSDKQIRSWNLLTGEPLKVFKKHTRGIEDLTFDEGEAFLFSASSDGHIIKWNPLSGECLQIFEGHLTSVYALKVFDEEMWTASADMTVKRWDLYTGKSDMSLEHPDFVKCLAICGPYIITGSRDESIRVFDIGSGKLIKVIDGHFDEVSCTAVREKSLYTGSLDCTLRMWSLTDIASQEPQSKPTVQEETSSSLLTEEEERELKELMETEDM